MKKSTLAIAVVSVLSAFDALAAADLMKMPVQGVGELSQHRLNQIAPFSCPIAEAAKMRALANAKQPLTLSPTQLPGEAASDEAPAVGAATLQ